MVGNSNRQCLSVTSRALAILAAFDQRRRRLTLTELAARTELPVPTAHRLVNPTVDIPRILALFQSRGLELDELITRTYTLDEVDQGYDDLLNGHNIRGVLVHATCDTRRSRAT